MAEEEALGGLISSGTAETFLNSAVIGIVIILIVGAIGLGLYFWYNKLKRYKQFKCVIFRKDSFGQIQEKYDDAGIFVDSRTKNKRLFLRKSNVGLDPDNIPYIQTVKGKTIYMFQTGLKNFRYIKVNVKDPKIGFVVGEEDVNWAINAYDRQKKLFQNDKWMQLLPFIALAFTSIIILTIFIYFFKNFDVLKDVANALLKVAEELVKAGADTVIIEGSVPLP